MGLDLLSVVLEVMVVVGFWVFLGLVKRLPSGLFVVVVEDGGGCCCLAVAAGSGYGSSGSTGPSI